MSLPCQQHSLTAQHCSPSPGSRGPSSPDLQQQQPGEDKEVSTSFKVQIKTAFDWSVSCVKFLLAYNLRNMIQKYDPSVSYHLSCDVWSHCNPTFTLRGTFSGIQALICTWIMQMCENYSESKGECFSFLFGPGMGWAAPWSLLKKGPNVRSKVVIAHKDQWIQELLQISNWH